MSGSPEKNGRFTVLIADDTPDFRVILKLALDPTPDFHVVGEAADGREAVATAARDTPDAVILDLAMPQMDGLQAIPEIQRVSPHTKILVLSGIGAGDVQEQALSLGAHAYLEKGGSVEDIARKLLEICSVDDRPPTPIVHPGTDAAEATEIESAPETFDETQVLYHELRNQVAVVLGYVQRLMASRDRGIEVDLDSSLRIIRRNAHQMQALLETFSDARRLQQGELRVEVARADIGRLVRETVADISSITSPHPTSVSAPNGVMADVDPTRIRQVLINLVSNAAKFSPPEAPIEITVEDGGDHVAIAVADHGPGVPPEKRAILFQRFGRLDETVDGSGLGLYICRGIARLHRGDLELTDRHPGCTFVLELPKTSAA